MTPQRERESGFTIIEVVVAVFILVMAALATFGLLSSATKNTERAKATQVALDRAQQEMEALRGLTNKQLALTAQPPASADRLNPDYRVDERNNSFALTREPPGNYRTMVVEGEPLYGNRGFVEGGVVSPGPTSFTSGGVSGKVYRYIVWRNDESCSEEKCPGKQDYKQIVIVVKPDKPASQAAERGYVEVQSDFIDPTDSAEQDPKPNSEEKVITAQQFFLSDTPCASPPPTVRQEIAGDHLLHNTLGSCANGLQTGGTPGAPDALVLSRPPDAWPEDPSLPPFYDYSNDEYLEPSPDTDHGVQLLTPKEKECHYSPTGTHPEAQVHRWVTDPMASNFTLTEKATIEFYTRTLKTTEDTTGRLCVYLYRRNEKEEDSPLTNKFGNTAYWTYTPPNNAYWPRLEWTKVRLTMYFNSTPYTIFAKERLGVALSVEQENTPAEAIPVLYDHPNFPTRLEVDTSTPLEGG